MTTREEFDSLMAQAEILECISFLKAFGKHISGFELIQEAEGKSVARWDKGAQA